MCSDIAELGFWYFMDSCWGTEIMTLWTSIITWMATVCVMDKVMAIEVWKVIRYFTQSVGIKEQAQHWGLQPCSPDVKNNAERTN